MKKLVASLVAVFTILALSVPALADIAPLPRPDPVEQATKSPIVPIILAVVIIAVVILVKALRKKKGK